MFEAASWALAEQRMPAERRRELWLEPLPAAELAGAPAAPAALRLGLGRRAVPHGERVAAGPPRDRDGPPQEGTVPTTVHILLDGRVTTRRARGAASSTVEAPAALGFVEAMAGLAMPETNTTSGSAVTLR